MPSPTAHPSIPNGIESSTYSAEGGLRSPRAMGHRTVNRDADMERASTNVLQRPGIPSRVLVHSGQLSAGPMHMQVQQYLEQGAFVSKHPGVRAIDRSQAHLHQ